MSTMNGKQEVNGCDGLETGTRLPESSPEKRKPLNNVHWLVLVGLVFLSYFAFSRVGVQVVEVMGDSMAPSPELSTNWTSPRS